MGDDRHGWGPLLDDLERRLAAARAMGGREKLEKRRAEGRLNARERVARLLDADSFVELGALAAGARKAGEAPTPADGFVAGFGRQRGRPLLVGAEDFTRAGRLDRPRGRRQALPPDPARGAGARAPRVRARGRRPPHVERAAPPRPRAQRPPGLASLSGLVPTVCVVLGASAGHGALAAPLMDFVVMGEGAALFAAGPPLVIAVPRRATSTRRPSAASPCTPSRAGVAHNVAPDDAAALDAARSYLSYFPASAWEAPPRAAPGPTPASGASTGSSSSSRRTRGGPTRCGGSSRASFDAGSVSRDGAPPRSVRSSRALAFLGGQSVAVVANNPRVRAGALDAAAAQKARASSRSWAPSTSPSCSSPTTRA